MALDTSVAPSPLITPDELPTWISLDFLGQFRVRAITVVVTTPGALGTMRFTWRLSGDPNVSEPVPSEEGTPWAIDLPEPSWCTLKFAAGTYSEGATYTVSRMGTVTGPDGLLTATRRELVLAACEAATGEAVNLMQPRCKPPIQRVGIGHKQHLARLVVYALKYRDGFTPPEAGTGDDNIVKAAEEARRVFRDMGRSDNRPPDVVDSSPGNRGAGIPLMPRSRSRRGFGEFS